MKPIVFIDMRDRDKQQRSRLENLKCDLELRKGQNNGALTCDQETLLETTEYQLQVNALRDEAERYSVQMHADNLAAQESRTEEEEILLKRLQAQLKADTALDPLFNATRAKLVEFFKVGEHRNGRLPSQTERPPGHLTADEKKLIAVFGLLQLDNADPTGTRFAERVTVALGEYVQATDPKNLFDKVQATDPKNLFDKVLDVLVGDSDSDGSTERQLRSDQVAAVFRALCADGVTAGTFQVDLRVKTKLAEIGGGSDDEGNASVEIDLPDLELEAKGQIVADNLKALQCIYFSAMLEEMRFFQAIDTALEQWHLGMIVLTRGAAGTKFYKYWRKTSDRFSEIERRSLYSRAFGIPGGEAVQGAPNREFKVLWLRFLSAVSSVARQLQVDNLLRANIPVGVSQEIVRQSGRDLASNLSLHGYGIAYFAATELQAQINEIKDLLSDVEVQAAYGARDMFQVIEQIIMLSEGTVVNSVQKRVSANAGSIIIRWLADHADKLSGIGYGSILDIPSIRGLSSKRIGGDKPTTKPTDADLVNAVEQWIAVNGIQDAFIEENSQAAEPPRMTSRPIQIPDFARELVGDLPIPMAAGASNVGRRNGNGPAGNAYGRH